MTDNMKASLAVAIGGAAGALLRSGVNSFFITSEFPAATLIENIIGSFLLGLLTGWVLQRKVAVWLKAGIGTGFCGGFTTMSTFAADSFFLWQTSSTATLLYIGASLFGGLLAAFVGVVLVTEVFKKRGEVL
ncbi:CrcB family protein [Bacillus tianshenii]|nr:CrcB family protein [Bacillus tianshenii]